MVGDFEDGVDKIQFSSGVSNFNSLTLYDSGVGAGVLMPSGTALIFYGLTEAQLTVDDFIFG